MRRGALALALAVGISGCFEVGRGVMPEPTPEPMPEPTSEASPLPTPTPMPLPRPFLPFVKRLDGLDRLFLFDVLHQEIVEIPEAFTGGPIRNPFYFEVRGESRILYNSGAVIECPEGSGILVPDIEAFGAYVLDVPRRLRYRLSEDDYFLSAGTADGRLFAHLDVTEFSHSQRIALVLEGADAPYDDEEVLVASLDLEPGLLGDVSVAAWGRWVAAVKGPKRTPSCQYPPKVDGRLFLFDLLTFRLESLSEAYALPPVQAVALSPSGRQVIMVSGAQVLRLDRFSGEVDAMTVLNQSRGDGAFLNVRFLAASEEVFYLEYRTPEGRTRILSYDWRLHLLRHLPLLNLVEDPSDYYLAPP